MSFLLPAIDTWAQWASVFDDVAVWRPAVDAICGREGIVYDRIEAPASNTNAVFILDRRVVVKIYSPFFAEFAFERSLMALLQRDAVVPLPAVRAVGVLRDRRDWSYLAMTFCAGRPWTSWRRSCRLPPCWMLRHRSAAPCGGCTPSNRNRWPPSTRARPGPPWCSDAGAGSCPS